MVDRHLPQRQAMYLILCVCIMCSHKAQEALNAAGYKIRPFLTYLVYCIVFIHFYSASYINEPFRSTLRVPTSATDIVLELTRRSTTGNCK